MQSNNSNSISEATEEVVEFIEREHYFMKKYYFEELEETFLQGVKDASRWVIINQNKIKKSNLRVDDIIRAARKFELGLDINDKIPEDLLKDFWETCFKGRAFSKKELSKYVLKTLKGDLYKPLTLESGEFSRFINFQDLFVNIRDERIAKDVDDRIVIRNKSFLRDTSYDNRFLKYISTGPKIQKGVIM